MIRLTAKVLAILACVVSLSIVAAPNGTGAAGGTRANLPLVPHAFVIVMENKNAGEIVRSSNAPYMNGLLRQYGYASNYYGVTHPSLPNYVASIAGDIFNVYDDWAGNRFGARNIADQLEARHLTWKAYMGGLPYPGYAGDQYPNGPLALYARKHDPFMLMNDVLRSPTRRRHVVPETQLLADLKSGRVPTLSYISPNLCDDMHGITASGSPCPPVSSSLIRRGDHYLSGLVPAIMRSPAWKADSVIFIVWDESEAAINGCCDDPKGDGGGRIPAIVIARQGPRHYRSSTPYNHYALLKTLQTVWHLPCLANTCDSRHVHPMLPFLARG